MKIIDQPTRVLKLITYLWTGQGSNVKVKCSFPLSFIKIKLKFRIASNRFSDAQITGANYLYFVCPNNGRTFDLGSTKKHLPVSFTFHYLHASQTKKENRVLVRSECGQKIDLLLPFLRRTFSILYMKSLFCFFLSHWNQILRVSVLISKTRLSRCALNSSPLRPTDLRIWDVRYFTILYKISVPFLSYISSKKRRRSFSFSIDKIS